MNEFMGLVRGVYEAKQDGFLPGGASLHMCMTPHGPDVPTYTAATREDSQQPMRLDPCTLAFMFEVSLTPRVTPAALGSPCIDQDYYKCWWGLKSHFDRDWYLKKQQRQQEQQREKEQMQNGKQAAADGGMAPIGLVDSLKSVVVSGTGR
eukprot:GHRR01032059.1.p1 GENE.GHRR01032059.1~~GHRR01032059.1.p1  ORF type:complete len:163 (-),score=46.44 GHRR01032059.1:222-671(-)